MEAGFPVVARGPQGEVRAIESPSHQFFRGDVVPAATVVDRKESASRSAGLRASGRRLGQEKLDDSVLE